MYDIIGDIHGHADSLELLLQKLGYKKIKGIYQHPEKRKVIFVGDFIDRGPKIRETLHLVKDMCDSGNAEAVMGNHEYNAICYHAKDDKGNYFRKHSTKNLSQHSMTLAQFFFYSEEWKEYLEWFKTLPLFLEHDDFRVVHACWDNAHIKWIKENYTGISTEFLKQATNQDDSKGLYKIIEETLKGKEAVLPRGLFFYDKDNTKREECRVKWWAHADQRERMGQVFVECPKGIQFEETDSVYHTYSDSKPVFFGHYWLNGLPVTENENAICLDYSVAKGGALVACRLTKENGILKKQFVY